MLFNSYLFWAFFAIVLLLYHRLARRRQNWLLLISSYIFYGAWDWRFLLLVFVSTFVDYFIALGLDRCQNPRTRRLLISCSLAVQLGLLGFFKYYNFFSHELIGLLQHLGLNVSLMTLKVILPVGISFYTFQSMSYTIDVYRRRSKPVTDLLDFALYVCFFPQLVAGPIERSHQLVPQFAAPRQVRLDDYKTGIYQILFGLFKKVVVADNLAPLVNGLFHASPQSLSGVECWLGVYTFAIQIYCDFSGYSLIAQGVGRLMGFKLMSNFKMPYFALSPSDFWRRWHISLSQWLRDYLYISLGGNRCSRWKVYRNLLVTMILGGLWHGANWTYIAWGFFHGLLLCVWRLFQPREPRPEELSKLSRLWRMALMFHLVCIGWLFFRAESIGQAWAMLGRMLTDFHPTSLSWSILGMLAFFAGPLGLYEYWLSRKDQPMRLLETHWLMRGVAYSYMAAMLLIFVPAVRSEFIYFQF